MTPIMAMRSQTQRSLLLGFIGSIVCCGLVGVYCLVMGQFGTFEARVLGTTAVVGAASILGLASAIPWERRRWHPIGPIGLATVAVALILVLVAIWGDLPWRSRVPLMFLKTVGVACVVGVALPHVGLLSLARLRREYGWVRRGTVYVIAALAAMIAYTIITEIDDDEWLRAMGVVGIAVFYRNPQRCSLWCGRPAK